jgi:hypothetical protein
MHDFFSHIPTTTPVPTRGFGRAMRWRHWATTSLLLAVVGCQTAPMVTPPSANFRIVELALPAQRAFEDCIASFYQDDWDRTRTAAERLKQISDRWKEQTPPPGSEEAFRPLSAGFAEHTASLQAAVAKKETNGVTGALRLIAKDLGGLKEWEKAHKIEPVAGPEPMPPSPSDKVPPTTPPEKTPVKPTPPTPSDTPKTK